MESIIKNINEIKLYKDYKTIDSFIEKQLIYLYHSTKSSNDLLKLLKESIESFSQSNDQNDLILEFSILNSFSNIILVNKLKLFDNNNYNKENKDIRDNNDNELLINIDIGLLDIYKWLLNGLFNYKIKFIDYYNNQYKQQDITLLKELLSNILYKLIKLLEIPEFLKTIEEQKSFINETEYIESINKSKLYQSKILIIFEIISNYFVNEIDKNQILNIEYKSTNIKQLFFRLLEFKLIYSDIVDQQKPNTNNSSSDIILKHWTNSIISNEIDKILLNFKNYINRKHNFINSLIEFYEWSKSDIESHFKLLSSSTENENRWRYNTPYIHSFFIFITSLSTIQSPSSSSSSSSPIFELFYKSSFQFHKFINSIILNLLNCTNSDIRFKSIDLIIYIKNNLLNNNQIKLFFTDQQQQQQQHPPSSTNQIYDKLFDLLKLIDPSVTSRDKIEKCTKLVFDLLFVLYPINSQNQLINPFITTTQSSSSSSSSSSFNNNNNNNNFIESLQKSQTQPNQNNFQQYYNIILLLISNLSDMHQQQQPFHLIKKTIFLNECKRIFTVLGLYSIQYFKILLPTLLTSIDESSLKTDKDLIISILQCLNEILKHCWIRLTSISSPYTKNIINSILPLYNFQDIQDNLDNNNNNNNIYNNQIESIIEKLYNAYKTTNRLSEFYKIINDNHEINQDKLNFIINKIK